MSQPYDSFSPFPTAAGYPSHSGIEIPQIWSKQLADKFYPITVLSSISTTKYEGEIKGKGDSVIVRKRPEIAIRELEIGQALHYDVPQATTVVLPINRAKYFGIIADDIDASQMDMDWTPTWMNDAAQSMKEVVDREVLAWLPSHVSAANCGIAAGLETGTVNLGTAGAPVAITKANVVDVITQAGQVLDEQNIPDDGRFMVMPPAMRQRIMTSELKDASLTGDPKSPLRNGIEGSIDRFTLLKSNCVSSAIDTNVRAFNVVFGWNAALAFAQTVQKTEKLRSQAFFGDLIRGMQVYGYQVILPEALGNLYCYFSTAEAS